MAEAPTIENTDWAVFSQTDLDLNSSVSFTPWDVSDYANISIQLEGLSTTPSDDLVVTVQFSNNNSDFWYTDITLTGSSYGLGSVITSNPLSVDVSGVRYLQLAVTTANGSALTGDAKGVASNLVGKDLRVPDGPLRPSNLLHTLGEGGYRTELVRGYNDYCTSAAIEIMGSGHGAARYTWSMAAETLTATGGGNDSSLGAGARQLTVEGLDATGAEITETITTNGVSATTPTTQSFMRVNRFYVSTSGTYTVNGNYGANIGDIVLIGNTSGNTYSVIEAYDGIANQAVFTIPLGWTGYLHSLAFNPNQQTSHIRVWQRQDILDVTAPYTPKKLLWNVVGAKYYANKYEYVGMPVLPALTDIWSDIQALTASATQAAIDINLLLKQD